MLTACARFCLANSACSWSATSCRNANPSLVNLGSVPACLPHVNQLGGGNHNAILGGNSPKPWMVKRNTMPQATLFPNISPHNLHCCSTHLPSLLLMIRPRPSKKGRYIHRAAETVDTSGADDAQKLWRCTDYCAPTNPFFHMYCGVGVETGSR
ncbi:hypothetical protein IWZ03DRAFT_373906 [Phyllosticta citriasiana]|uniref:Secreted protein n=1 Tax=Phyllosticta citriasiana TaxID=595635 RepID=A0ABR1KQ31_9PEZI